MAKEILMPKMGMTMESGTIAKWLVEEGAAIEKGDVLLTVETDKAALDVEAFVSGTLLKILVKEGETVPVLQPIGLIGEPGEQVSVPVMTADLTEKPAPEPGEAVRDRSAGPSGDAGSGESGAKEAGPAGAGAPEKQKDGRWGVKSTPLAKRMAEERGIALDRIPSNSKGIITEKEVLAFTDTGNTDIGDSAGKRIKSTPAAAKMAGAWGVDLGRIEKDGRIYKQDVVEMAAQKGAMASFGEKDGTPPQYLEQGRIRKVAAEMLTRAWTTIPMVTNSIELDMTEVLKLCDWLNGRYAGRQMNIGITDVMIKVLAFAMENNPNANVRLEGGRLRCLPSVDIGMAAATESGLTVPVLRNANKKSLLEINSEKKELTRLAREGRLSPEHLGGASTTLSNMGAYRAEMFTPIINPPESCIFGTGTVKKQAVVIGDDIVIRPIMWLNFTYDHRILDGAQAARLLNTVKDVTELPSLLAGYEPF